MKPVLHTMSFREKSAWACLLVTVGVWVPFLAYAFRCSLQQTDLPGFAGLAFIAAILLTAVLSIAAHLGIALQSRREPEDERELAIEVRSLRNAYAVLLCSLGAILFTPTLVWKHAPATGLRWELLLLYFIMAETTRFLSQVIYYRCGLSTEQRS